MNRELVLLTLSASVCGLLTFGLGHLPSDRTRVARDGCAAAAEARSWRRLLLPLLPALWALAALVGWACQEPAVTDEPVRPIAFALAAVFLLVGVRAAIRALRAFRPIPATGPASTVGLIKPHVVISPALRDALDVAALAAARAHEDAHARHRDPLRIWVAQLAADLQWPSLGARRRLRAWRHALELARDEEARRNGILGGDLASAIVGAAKLVVQGTPAGTAAALTGPEHELSARIHRLLEPLPPPPVRRGSLVAALVVGGALIAAGAGLCFGDTLVRAIPFVSAPKH